MTVLAVAAVPRAVAMLGFRPALLTEDSFVYLRYGLHLAPDWMRPTGYSILLAALHPVHTFSALTGLQHVAGLAVGACVYLLLRAKGVPEWGAVLAAAPTLFDPRQIWLEQAVLSDLWFEVLAFSAVALLLVRRNPARWQVALAGLAAGWATITRGNGFPVIVVVLGYLLITKAGWRKAGVAALACAVPVLGYMGAFYARYGDFTISDGDGLFLWARTMSFASCAVIRPAPDLVPLCPDRQPGGPQPAPPGWSWAFLTSERQPAAYLWDKRSWLWAGPRPGLNPAGNRLAMRFALSAITAQPFGYLRAVTRDVLLTFLNTDRSLQFRPYPHMPQLSRGDESTLRRYGGTAANTRAVQPWAFLMLGYQQTVYFSGVLFGAVMVTGLAAAIRRRRHARAPALLAWITAALIIVVPVALSEYDYRYAIPAVPLACLAAALAFASRAGEMPPSWHDGRR